MRGPLELLPLSILAALCALLPAVAAAEPVSWCSGSFGFAVEVPEGWTLRSEETALGLALSFEPASGAAEPTVAIGVLVPRERSEATELDQALDEWVGLLGAFGRPLETRPLELEHPALRTRGAVVRHRNGEVTLAVAGGEGGRLFHVTMARVGGPASDVELAALRTVVASLRAESAAVCENRPPSAPAAGAP